MIFVPKKAFSIIELSIVLSLLFIILTVFIPKKHFFTDLLLQHEIENLFSTIKFLQQKAIAGNTKQELVFSIEKNSYFYVLREVKASREVNASQEVNASGEKVVIHQLPKQLKFGYLKNAKGPPASPKKPLNKPITFRYKKIIFRPNGKISSGTVYMIDNQQKFLKALTCSVSQVSFIRKYQYNPSATQKNKLWTPF